MPRRRGRAEAGMHPTLTHRAATAAGPRPAGSDTLAGLLARRLDESPHAAAIAVEASPADGTRHWTWADLAAAAAAVADAFVAAGLRRGDRVAHVGPHAPDWIVVDLACLLAGLEHAAVHHGGDVADEARSLAWLAPRAVIRSGVPGRPGDPPQIVVEPTGGGDVDGVRCAGIEAAAPSRAEADLADLRATIARHAAACDPEAGCAVLLSSGTTGVPLGYVHSQRALAANAVAASDVFLAEPRDVRLSWLPLSHGMARVGDLYTTLVRGGCLHVVRDRRRCLDACRALPPTVVLGVPAFFERIERGVRAGRIADLAAALGGRVRVCVSGGAALRARTAECFAARGVPLVEGYGLAEAGPVVAVSNPRIARPGTVGPPLAGVEVRIDDRPASRGQVLVRTPSRAVAVLAPAETGGVRTDRGAVDGWIETGDVGELDAAGHLRITGRLRDTLVLSNGTKLPPAAVERALAEDEAVAQVCVVGDGLPWPVAVIVPDPDEVREALRRLGIRVFSRRAALEHPRLLAWLGRRLVRRQERLPRGWRVRRAFLVGRPFDAAHGEATESLKIRRDRVAEHFAARIAAAAESAPPRWACAVPTGESADDRGPAAPWLTTALWRGADGGFAAAAERAAVPSREPVNAVVDRASAELARLRADGTLYDPPPASPAPAAPLADAPAPPAGRFSAAAEAALGRTGLWGLAVPERFGGTGAGMLDLARAITRLAADCPTAAGMLAVHSTIGAVTALAAFGSDEQQARLLPGLAAGSPLSIFGATEPDVGCDLGAVRATLKRRDGRLLLTGTKMFITNATHGRLMKVLALLDGRPAVALVRLPAADGPTFRLRHYAIHPLRHAHNAATEFTGFAVDEADLLAAPGGDGMRIVWHGLNRGRTTLAAQAAGTLRILLAQARAHALARSTWGRPIADRELVRGRLARIAAAIAACDAVSAWAAAAIDSGGTGELEAIVAKTTASECVRAAAIDALGVHGGRAFLVGHPLGDSFHDHLAVGVYEGESDLLSLALLKGLAKGWPPTAAGRDAPALRRAAAWLAWRAATLARGPGRDGALLDRRLRDHARAARRLLSRAARRIDRAIRRHGRSLAERQLVAGALAADVRDLAAVLATCHHADATARDAAAADCFCRLALARVRGARPSAADHAALAALGASAVSGPS